SVIDTDLGGARRKSIPGQRRHDHIEIPEHRQHVNVIEEAAGPTMGEYQRRTAAGFRTLMDEMDAFPDEVIESVEPLLPRAPVELIGPIGDDVLQPLPLGALFPLDAGDLVGPSGTAQALAQIVEDLILDMNAKWFQHEDSSAARSIAPPSD